MRRRCNEELEDELFEEELEEGEDEEPEDEEPPVEEPPVEVLLDEVEGGGAEVVGGDEVDGGGAARKRDGAHSLELLTELLGLNTADTDAIINKRREGRIILLFA